MFGTRHGLACSECDLAFGFISNTISLHAWDRSPFAQSFLCDMTFEVRPARIPSRRVHCLERTDDQRKPDLFQRRASQRFLSADPFFFENVSSNSKSRIDPGLATESNRSRASCPSRDRHPFRFRTREATRRSLRSSSARQRIEASKGRDPERIETSNRKNASSIRASASSRRFASRHRRDAFFFSRPSFDAFFFSRPGEEVGDGRRKGSDSIGASVKTAATSPERLPRARSEGKEARIRFHVLFVSRREATIDSTLLFRKPSESFRGESEVERGGSLDG